MSLLHPPRLIPASDFARDAVAAINRSSSRVALVVTTIRADDTASQHIVDALCRAAARDVIVTVCADSYTYTEPKEFILRSPKRHPMRAYHAIKIEHELKSHGADFHWLGSKSNIGFAGRTHSKWLIVDDTIYSFGGINIDAGSFANNDFMLRIRNRDLADQLFLQHLRLLKADRANHATKNHQLKVDDHSTVLIDGGLVANSIIYRRACQLAREAHTITLVSQYCPTGKLQRLLAHKQATLYFNHWRKANWFNRLLISFGMLTTRQSTRYTREQYLHAKFMIFTLPDGKKVALTGSHNFMFTSGLIGTREIALETTDRTIIGQLERFLDNHVK
jgi:cardiolipin synthase